LPSHPPHPLRRPLSLVAQLGCGAQWQTSTFGLQRETPDWIRGPVFAAAWGFATLTTAISSLLAIAADRFGATAATIGVASICIVWAVWWWSWTWKLWRAPADYGSSGISAGGG
jgi:hypothetical protein